MPWQAGVVVVVEEEEEEASSLAISISRSADGREVKRDHNLNFFPLPFPTSTSARHKSNDAAPAGDAPPGDQNGASDAPVMPPLASSGEEAARGYDFVDDEDRSIYEETAVFCARQGGPFGRSCLSRPRV